MAKRKNKKKSGIPVDRPMQKPGTHHIWLAAILILHAVLGLIYWTNTPFGDSPDEYPHARYVEFIAESHGFPIYTEGDESGYEFYQPPLYYMLGVPFYMIGRAIGMDNPLEAIRLLSLILGGLSILVIYLAVAKAFPEDKRMALASSAFVALLPTHVMISGSVSNDILTELVFGLFFLITAQILIKENANRSGIFLGLVLGIGILTKMTCMILFVSCAVLCILFWKYKGGKTSVLVGRMGAIAAISILVGGWWLVRNQAVYSDPLALGQMQASFLSHSPTPDYFFTRGMAPSTYLLQVLVWTFTSFWGVFGHMTVFMPGWVYWVLALCTVTSLIGLRRGLRYAHNFTDTRNGLIIIYAFTLGLMLMALLKINMTFFQSQGRFLFPALVPISVFWLLGYRGLLPEQSGKYAMYAALVAPLLAQIAALVTSIVR